MRPELGLADALAAAGLGGGPGADVVVEARDLLEHLDRVGLTVTAKPAELEAGTFTLLGATGEHQPVVLTALGSRAAILEPRHELAFVLDVAGRRNRPPSSGDYSGPPELVEERYLLTPGQGAELIVALGRAAHDAGPDAMAAFDEALEAL